MTNELVVKEKNFLSDVSAELAKRMETELSAIGSNFNTQRFIMNSVEAVRQCKLIDKPVSPMQVVNGLMKGAYLHLDFFQGECYLIYYRDRGLTFQTDYKGEVKLAKLHSIKPVFEIYAEVVREGDEYEKVTIQSQRYINHKPKRFNNGNIEGAYAVVKYVDGSSDMVEVSVEDIEKIRNTYSKAPNSGAWVNRYVEMCKKTVLRLLCKNIQLDFTTEQFEAYQEGGDCEFEKPKIIEKAVNPFDTPEVVEAEVINEEVPPEEPEQPQEQPLNEFICSKCGIEISDKVSQYSISKFGKPLCYKCQKEVKA